MKTTRSLLLGISLATAIAAVAYPISPRPLRMLVQESELILRGRVLSIEDREETEDHWDNNIARIRVTAVLKGHIKDTVVEVIYTRFMVCPAPPRYFPDTDVLVFLDRDGKKYHTHALSYGAKTLDSAGMAIYAQRISEMLSILEMPDAYERERSTLEWLVRCAEEGATRWEGTYELSRGSDFMGYYDRSDERGFAGQLTSDHRKRLLHRLLQVDTLDRDDLGLIDLVHSEAPEQVDSLLLNELRRPEAHRSWFMDDLAQRLPCRSKGPAAEQALKDLLEVNIWDIEKEADWQKRRRQLDAYLAFWN